MLMKHTTFVGFPISERKHPLSKLVDGLVCEKCNNGWMSQLESECQNHILNLMNMREVIGELNYLKENSECLSKWAFKSAILLNHASNFNRLVPDEHYASLYSGRIPDNVFVGIAFCEKETKLEWRQSAGGVIIRSADIQLNLEAKRYRITFQMGRLLMNIKFYESPHSVYYEDDGAIRLYPQFGLCGEAKFFDGLDRFDNNGIIHEYHK